MSEQTSYSAQALLEAYVAILRAGEDPRLPLAAVRAPLALNRNSLRPAVEALEESRAELLRRHGVRIGADDRTVVIDENCRTPREQMARLDSFHAEHRELLARAIEWAPCARIPLRAIPEDASMTASQLAALLAVGIVVPEAS